jgi:hypothetical protein
VPYGDYPPVLHHHRDLPVAVLLVLPEQIPRLVADVVLVLDARGDENLAARPGDPEVELLVLIPDHLFVEHADPLEDFAAHGRKHGALRITLEVFHAMPRPADAHRTRHRLGHSPAERTSPAMHDRPPDGPGLGMLAQQVEIGLHEVGRHSRVPIHPDHDVAGASRDGNVESARGTEPRVVHHPHTRVFCRQPLEDLARTVVGHRIGDHDFIAGWHVGLRQQCANTVLDVPPLVAARHDDGDGGQGANLLE